MTFPTTPYIGQKWLDGGRVWQWNGTAWQAANNSIFWEEIAGKPTYMSGSTIVSTSAPANPIPGLQWWNQTAGRLFIWDGAAWVEPNTNYPVGDPDVWNYVLQVEGMDGQPLETGVVSAIGNFIYGCKADGIWDAIKSACLLAGARTLAGALIPLKGIAPTNVNFMASDYNRKTGLKGDASTKYLISNRLNNADPVTNKHIFAYATEGPSGGSMTFIGSERQFSNSGAGESSIFTSGGVSQLRVLLNDTNETILGHDGTLPNKPYGLTRSPSSPDVVNWLVGNNTGSYTRAAGATASANRINVFRHRDSGGGNSYAQYSNARMSFYSIGESLDLTTLNSRVSTLMTEINTEIL